MGAQENKQSAQAAYEAFGNGDAEGAMANIDDSVSWTVRGRDRGKATLPGAVDDRPQPFVRGTLVSELDQRQVHAEVHTAILSAPPRVKLDHL